MKDLGIKAEIYTEVGIPEYWVVNLRAGKIIVFRQPLNENYRSRQEIIQGELSPLAFPEVTIPVHALLR